MAETTSVIAWKFLRSLRSNFAPSRARCSQSARFLASVIDSKSSTCATPTILLSIRRCPTNEALIIRVKKPNRNYNKNFVRHHKGFNIREIIPEDQHMNAKCAV